MWGWEWGREDVWRDRSASCKRRPFSGSQWPGFPGPLACRGKHPFAAAAGLDLGRDQAEGGTGGLMGVCKDVEIPRSLGSCWGGVLAKAWLVGVIRSFS